MRRRSRFPYILALLAATQASVVVAAEEPVVPTPRAWLTGTQSPVSPTSWQPPLQGGSQSAFPKNPQLVGATHALPSKQFVAGPPEATGHCSSSGPSSQAVGCAAFVAISAAVHSVQQ